MSDADALWLADPLQDFTSPPVVNSSIVASRGSFPEYLGERWGSTICMGFILFRTSANGAMRKFWTLMKQLVVECGDDQRAVNRAAWKLGIEWDKLDAVLVLFTSGSVCLVVSTLKRSPIEGLAGDLLALITGSKGLVVSSDASHCFLHLFFSRQGFLSCGGRAGYCTMRRGILRRGLLGGAMASSVLLTSSELADLKCSNGIPDIESVNGKTCCMAYRIQCAGVGRSGRGNSSLCCATEISAESKDSTSSSRSAAAAGRGRMMASLDAAKREKSTLAACAEGAWRPRAFSPRGQRALSPLGGVRCLSSHEKEGHAKEEEEGATSKDEEEGDSKESPSPDSDGGDEADEDSLREELAKTTEQLKDTREKALYLAAEMENVRSIAKRDAESARLYAVQKFAKQLLDVADNLERAIASAKEAGDGGGDSSHDVLLQGVEMTSQELTKVFRSQGLEKYGEVSDKFDPHLHDAMFEFEDPAQEPGTLGQVLKCGYTLHGRVIRAAQVGTVKAT
eukprot:g18992.t2